MRGFFAGRWGRGLEARFCSERQKFCCCRAGVSVINETDHEKSSETVVVTRAGARPQGRVDVSLNLPKVVLPNVRAL